MIAPNAAGLALVFAIIAGVGWVTIRQALGLSITPAQRAEIVENAVVGVAMLAALWPLWAAIVWMLDR